MSSCGQAQSPLQQQRILEIGETGLGRGSQMLRAHEQRMLASAIPRAIMVLLISGLVHNLLLFNRLQVLFLYVRAPLSITLLGWCLVVELLWKLSIVQQGEGSLKRTCLWVMGRVHHQLWVRNAE